MHAACMEPSAAGAVRVPIAAKSIIFGVSNFFVLSVPPPWELLRGPFQPEVDRWTRSGNIVWVTEGRAAYLLHDRATARGIELHVQVKPTVAGLADRVTRLGDRVTAVGGHRAGATVAKVRRGFWPRRTLHRLRLDFVCEPLAREIALELIGAYGPELLFEVGESLKTIECH